ncbi:MAG TPA: hypothetical protein DFK15_00320 [Butyricimonas sp.]|uniref:hypothetical protein n=1 Tax=Butyricimonas sp. TaxID=1969738 RepID=UPI000EE96AB2|nr:hypothetical protein [Butyricimonas sp.]HAM83854.1 hypothetical protein [Butyricimonas sp.]HCH87715.1 hypothetical protein [Butyricimonas sp.]
MAKKHGAGRLKELSSQLIKYITNLNHNIMKTSSKTGEDYIKLLPSKVTEIYHREMEFINKDLEDETNKLCKRFLKLVEEGKMDNVISYLKRLDR